MTQFDTPSEANRIYRIQATPKILEAVQLTVKHVPPADPMHGEFCIKLGWEAIFILWAMIEGDRHSDGLVVTLPELAEASTVEES